MEVENKFIFYLHDLRSFILFIMSVYHLYFTLVYLHQNLWPKAPALYIYNALK